MQYRGDETTGFPSPARDYLQPVVDLTEILSLRAPGIYAVRVQGEGCTEQAILEGDILIADTSVDPVPGRIAVIFTPHEARLGVLAKVAGVLHVRLREGVIPLGEDVEVWGVVTGLVRTFS